MAAVPCVVVGYLISCKIFSAPRGRAIQLISVVMHAARTNNIAATMIFYSTLAVTGPICEILFPAFSIHARKTSMLLSALAFAGIHLDAGGLLPLFTLGMLFAFTFERTRSILPCIIAHANETSVHLPWCYWSSLLEPIALPDYFPRLYGHMEFRISV